MSFPLPPGILPILHKAQPQLLETLLDHDIRHVLLRSHGHTFAEYQTELETLKLLKQEWNIDFLVHHHESLYPKSGAIGLHTTAQSQPLHILRKQLGPEVLLGFSAHSLAEAQRAEDAGADYILLGAIFPTPKLHNHPVLGIDTLHAACSQLTIPVFAIGGITSENLWQIHAAGAYGFASLRALFEGETFDHNVGKLKWTWDLLVQNEAN